MFRTIIGGILRENIEVHWTYWADINSNTRHNLAVCLKIFYFIPCFPLMLVRLFCKVPATYRYAIQCKCKRATTTTKISHAKPIWAIINQQQSLYLRLSKQYHPPCYFHHRSFIRFTSVIIRELKTIKYTETICSFVSPAGKTNKKKTTFI